ncbi:hypothetical protein GCM10022419_073310 [Nonomuraea rosea]|uniref:Uncharacterized protein n=1 Tax=Nonomuraea rosea TaxID=638574 RepID=A0ABP6YF63_9ACTN
MDSVSEIGTAKASTRYQPNPNATLTSKYGAARQVIGSARTPRGPFGPNGTRSFNATDRMRQACPASRRE